MRLVEGRNELSRLQKVDLAFLIFLFLFLFPFNLVSFFYF